MIDTVYICPLVIVDTLTAALLPEPPLTETKLFSVVVKPNPALVIVVSLISPFAVIVTVIPDPLEPE